MYDAWWAVGVLALVVGGVLFAAAVCRAMALSDEMLSVEQFADEMAALGGDA